MFTKFFFTKRLILLFLFLSSCFYFRTTELFAQHAKKFAELTDSEYEAEYAAMTKNDDFTIDNNGNITSFKKTFPNLCQIVWNGNINGNYGLDDVVVTSYDGDTYKGLLWLDIQNGYLLDANIKKLYSNFKGFNPQEHDGKCPIKKEDTIENMWFLGSKDGFPPAILTFSDPGKLPIIYHDEYNGSKKRLKKVTSEKNPNDYIEVTQIQYYENGKWKWGFLNNDKTLTNGRYKITLEDGILIQPKKEWDDYIIKYNNGNVFEGRIEMNPSFASSTTFPRVKLFEVENKKIKDLVKILWGKITTPSNEVLVVTEGEIDKFETAKLKKMRQAEIEQQKETQKNMNLLISKYGKENAEALVKGQVRVGMTTELFGLGIAAGAFSRFNNTAISIDYGKGNYCLDLYKLMSDLNNIHVGFIWFTNDKVTSIVYYQ